MTAPAPNAVTPAAAEDLATRYQRVRAFTEHLCAPLEVDDYQIQSITETSPPKWHIAHVTWFFEAFVLGHFVPNYRPARPAFHYLFNSYYQTVGEMHPRPQRGLLSRPTVAEVQAYRAEIDQHMLALIARTERAATGGPQHDALAQRITLGLHHEQQHQELLLMDIKHNFWSNPLRPAYTTPAVPPQSAQVHPAPGWVEHPGGPCTLGAADAGFAYDNESPRHQTLLQPHRLADRLVTNAEFAAFIDDGGYRRPELWLADGWHWLQQQRVTAPLYWFRADDAPHHSQWQEFRLSGPAPLEAAAPVCHVSYFEADAFARWAGARLPTEAELEQRLSTLPVQGNFVDDGHLHPRPGQDQWFGDVWEWTQSPYSPYPGFRPLDGSLGEYNGKFMCNQYVLRGGCCLSSREHVRATYRNFFYPHDRWAMTGIRLAEDLQ